MVLMDLQCLSVTRGSSASKQQEQAERTKELTRQTLSEQVVIYYFIKYHNLDVNIYSFFIILLN